MGLDYPTQTRVPVIGSESSGTLTRTTLVDYYDLDGTTTKEIRTGGYSKMELEVSYLVGVGETSNTIEIIVEGSFDGGTNWYRFITDTTSGGTSTIAAREFTIAQSTTDGFLKYDAQSVNFTTGLLVSGSGTGTGWIESDVDDGTTGTLLLSNVAATFVNDETLTDSGSGSATVDGTLQSLTNFTLPIDISTTLVRVSVKETGKSTTFGTVYIGALLSGR